MRWSFLANVLREGTRESFGRVMALPFLVASLGMSVADGVLSLLRGQSALDAAASLALVGVTLFTGSKMLQMRGGSTGAPAPEAPAAAAQASAKAAEGDAG